MRKNHMSKLTYGLAIFIILLSGCNRIDNPQPTSLITNVPIETTSPIPSTIVIPTIITPSPTYSLESKDLPPDNTDSTITTFPDEANTDKTSISQNGRNSSSVTAEETVQQLFKYWQEKNSQGMDSLVIENKKGTDAQLDYLNSITLDSCTERTDKGNWDTPWYEKPYDYTCVDVTFTISNKKGAVVALSNGTYDWQYYLVKESEDSNWIIVMWGAEEGE